MYFFNQLFYEKNHHVYLLLIFELLIIARIYLDNFYVFNSNIYDITTLWINITNHWTVNTII